MYHQLLWFTFRLRFNQYMKTTFDFHSKAEGENVHVYEINFGI